ncbi:hypothetical protein [uncultured Christiangramia sp.]|uniref:hypothetical protein n=1 Tax=uncultured Christiangramia sp. TaxID=503836 RepID=UPI002620BA95|nr:hypothetical protein [uncultured Christiangramia sp.]
MSFFSIIASSIKGSGVVTTPTEPDPTPVIEYQFESGETYQFEDNTNFEFS